GDAAGSDTAGRDVPAGAGGEPHGADSTGPGDASPDAPPEGTPPAVASPVRPDTHRGTAPAASDPATAPNAPGTPAPPLDTHALLRVQAAHDPGPFTDATALRRCLRVNGLPAGARLIGAGPVHVDGRDGTLLLIPGPRPPGLTALVVTAQCGSGDDGLLHRAGTGPP